ncbi:hypothetical protein O9992_23820 [Vibrio lentus]|nr:hypothetical protein [Vibrio lentus]
MRQWQSGTNSVKQFLGNLQSQWAQALLPLSWASPGQLYLASNQIHQSDDDHPSLTAGVFGAISVTIDTHLTSYILSSVFNAGLSCRRYAKLIQALMGVNGVFALSYMY